MLTKDHYSAGLSVAVLLFLPVLAAAQTIAVTANAKVYTNYPSMEPVTVIDLDLGSDPVVIDAVRSAIRQGWDCKKLSSYQVSRIDGTTTSTDPILFVNMVGQKPSAPCDPLNLNLAQLTLQMPLSENDTFRVSLRGLPNQAMTIESAAKAGPKGGAQVAFSATPQSAVGEALVNKTTRDTGQLNVAFSDSNFVRNLPVDIYVKSTDLFSTDERDTKSAFSGVVGFNRGLFRNWYSPGHLEAGVQGNQIATNLSTVVSGGVDTLLPWRAVMTPMLQIAYAPELKVSGQYLNRLRQDPATVKKLLAENDFTMNPALSWTGISLPWTCTFFGWLNGDKSNAGAKAADQYKYCAGVELNVGAWYLPLDLTSRGSQRVEGYGDVSLLIPLASLSFAKGIAPHLTSGDYTKSRIRIKYSDTVNAANGYVRTKAWSYGIELIK